MLSLWAKFKFFVADNCSTNKSIPKRLSLPVFGFAIHRFNLAMEQLPEAEAEIIGKVSQLMAKLKTLLLAARLCKLTKLRAKTRNMTRWSSLVEMLIHYCAIKDFSSQLNSSEFDNLCLWTAESRRVENLLDYLTDWNSKTKALQYDSTTLNDVRGLFNAVIEQFP